MDLLHHPENKQWIWPQETGPMQMSSYVDGFMKGIKEIKESFETSKHQSKTSLCLPKIALATIPREIANEVSENCDVNNLTLEGEVAPGSCKTILDKASKPRLRPSQIPSEGLGLKTLRLQKAFLESAGTQSRYKRNAKSKYGHIGIFQARPPRRNGRGGHLVGKELIYTVRVYRPFTNFSKSQTKISTNNLKFSQEFLVLGSNMLTDIKDKIACNVDLFPANGSMSSNPNQAVSKRANEEHHSAFFFIEDTFYNDMRWPDCVDTSKVVCDWASLPRRKIGPLYKAKMEETKIDDLKIRLGYPYLYVHQGDHEHLIAFNDVRLASEDDSQTRGSYPRDHGLGMRHNNYCMVCDLHIPKWVTIGHEGVPEDPYFFCHTCFMLFNYDKDGRPIGNFKAYPYVDVNVI